MMNILLALVLAAGVQEDAAVESLLRRLDHDQPEERDRAAAALSSMGDVAIPRLEKLAAEASSAEVAARARRIVREIMLSPDIRAMIKDVTTGVWSWYGSPERPRLRGEVEIGVAREVRASKEVKKAYARLAPGRPPGDPQIAKDQRQAIETLKNAKAVYCLTSGLLLSSYLSQLDCAAALADLKDLRAVPTLLEVAAALAIPVDGSKQATVHGFRQHGIAKAIDRILGTSVCWAENHQNTAVLREGQAIWRAALAEARRNGK